MKNFFTHFSRCRISIGNRHRHDTNALLTRLSYKNGSLVQCLHLYGHDPCYLGGVSGKYSGFWWRTTETDARLHSFATLSDVLSLCVAPLKVTVLKELLKWPFVCWCKAVHRKQKCPNSSQQRPPWSVSRPSWHQRVCHQMSCGQRHIFRQQNVILPLTKNISR